MVRLSVSHHRIVSDDGVALSYTLWDRGVGEGPRRLFLILHGIGFHSGPYGVLAEHMDLPGTLFAGLDFRGHGRSGGRRGAPPRPGRTVADIARWVDHMADAYRPEKIFLLADSMAGPYGVLYAARYGRRLTGLALTAPAFLLSWRQILHPATARALLGLLTPGRDDAVGLGGERGRLATRDPTFLEAVAQDPYPLRGVSAGYLLAIAGAIIAVLLRPRLEVLCPVLVVHGQRDYVITPLGSRLLLWRLQAPDKRLILVPEAYHTLLWDPQRDTVLEEIGRWALEMERPTKTRPRSGRGQR